MSSPTYLYPPALAGICSHDAAAAAGISVDQTVMRLRRWVYLKSQLVFINAKFFNPIPEWEVKGAMSLHLWQDAEHSNWFRQRITEMRTPPHHLDKEPDPALGALIRELKHASGTLEFLVAVYRVLKPAMLADYRRHLAESHPIADQPTRRLINFMLEEEEDQIQWGEDAILALSKIPRLTSSDQNLVDWENRIRAFLSAAGGINGKEDRLDASTLPALRAEQRESSHIVPKRDARFPHVWRSRGVVPDTARPVHERLWWMMNVRLNEMHVSELIATVIADWHDQPWEFYHDLCRHLWDETRHCMLGEIAFASQGIDFTQIPTHIGFAEYPNRELPAPERYAFLWGIEQGLMTKTGKQAEVALAKEGGDDRATVFQDFDWADEVLHAAIGRRWLEPHFESRKAMLDVYERIRPAYDNMKEDDLKLAGRDWWPEFYTKHLQQKDPRLGNTST